MPYVLIVVLSIMFFVIDPKLQLCFDFPGYETAAGRIIQEENDYVSFNIFKFPLSIILMSTVISGIAFRSKKALDCQKLKLILKNTIKKCTSTTMTIVFLLTMAVVMMDSGMIENLALAMVAVSRRYISCIFIIHWAFGSFYHGKQHQLKYNFRYFSGNSSQFTGIQRSGHMCGAVNRRIIGGAIGPTTVALGPPPLIYRVRSRRYTGKHWYRFLFRHLSWE